MNRMTRACQWLSPEELKGRLKQTKRPKTVQKILVVLNASIEPALAEDIGARVGVARQTVHNWMSTYNRFGPEALFAERPGKPLQRYFTDEEECDQGAMVRDFIAAANMGRSAQRAGAP